MQDVCYMFERLDQTADNISPTYLCDQLHAPDDNATWDTNIPWNSWKSQDDGCGHSYHHEETELYINASQIDTDKYDYFYQIKWQRVPASASGEINITYEDVYVCSVPPQGRWSHLDKHTYAYPATLIGQVYFQGGTDQGTDRWVEVVTTTLTAGEDFTAQVYQSTTDQGGEFSIAGMLADTYDVLVKGKHSLANRRVDAWVPTPSASWDMCTLLEGDADVSGQVNIADFGLLAASYLKMCGSPGFNDMADFDKSCQVNIADFGLLAANYLRLEPIACPVRGGGRGGGRSGDVDLSIQPPSQTVSVNDVFTVAVRVDAGEQAVNGVDAFLDFGADDYLEVQSVTAGSSLPVPLVKDYDNASGVITLSFGSFSEPTGTFTLATIELKAKAQTAGTSITFSESAPRETNAVFEDQAILGTLTSGNVIIEP